MHFEEIQQIFVYTYTATRNKITASLPRWMENRIAYAIELDEEGFPKPA